MTSARKGRKGSISGDKWRTQRERERKKKKKTVGGMAGRERSKEKAKEGKEWLVEMHKQWCRREMANKRRRKTK